MTTDPDLSEFGSLTREEDLARQVTLLQGQLRKAKAKTEDLVQAVHEAARDAAVVLGNPPPVPKPEKDKRKGRPEVALLHLSDWQLGKRSESYNSDVAVRRVEEVAAKVVKITGIERADHPVRECHVMLGGDMVEGVQIFPGQSFEVDSTLFAQVFKAAGAIEALLRTMLATFERVVVHEEYGNHGRLGKKGDYPASDNIDLIVYRLAHERLREHESSGRLVWHEADSWYRIVVIGNYRLLLIHGDEIKGFGGQTPAFAIARKITYWAAGVLPPFRDAAVGHFHNPLALTIANGGRIFINPSTESDSAYAAEWVASSGVPGQRLFYVDPIKGRITTERILWLEHVV